MFSSISVHTSAASSVDLPELSCRLPLAELYEDLPALE
jgi:hypothetical protein